MFATNGSYKNIRSGNWLCMHNSSHNPARAVSFGQAMLVANWPFFGKSHMERSAPCLALARLFYSSLLIYLTYDSGGVWAL